MPLLPLLVSPLLDGRAIAVLRALHGRGRGEGWVIRCCVLELRLRTAEISDGNIEIHLVD